MRTPPQNQHQTELVLRSQEVSEDGSIKILWSLQDQQTIESVILPRSLKQRKNLDLWRNTGVVPAGERFTACVSSQVGCAMACDFCLTGKQGFVRQLTAAEIVSQVEELSRMKKITNVVFMGMGEPLQNTAAVTEAIRVLMDPHRLKLSRRKIIVSTSGVISEFDALAKTGVKLAISLNATTDVLRSQLMPINKKYPIAELIQAAKVYQKQVRQPVMIEYILLRGLNDSAQDAARLVEIADGWNCKVNLIPYNPFEETPYFRPEPEQVKQFQHALVSQGITATVRYSGGDDIYAACGQLKSLNAPLKKFRRGSLPPKE